MYIISKEFSFEAAHRLGKQYQGKCNNIHGHSWKCLVKVSCNKLDQYSMGFDFGDLKAILKPIEDELDHCIMLVKSDEELVKAMGAWGMKKVVFLQNPTSEVVAKYIYQKVQKELPDHVKMHSVLVNETCTSGCEYTEN